MQNQIPKNWQKVRLGDNALLNPTVILGKGNFPYIPMEDLDWNKKYVSEKVLKDFKGGAKFEEGDVLFARITPCLENGKIGKVKKLTFGKGFGSTEYFVIRGKERVTDTDFLYYLCRTNHLRQTARNSMVGASGRQRANIESLQNYELYLPDYSEQKRIASVLSSFDDKIELNNKTAKTLENIAQALFKEWFIHFRFPGYEKAEFVDNKLGEIPKGWTLGVLENFIGELESGKRPKGGVSSYKEGVPSIGAENIDGLDNSNFSNIKLIPESFFDSMNMGKIKDYDILIYKDGGVPGIFKVKFTIIGQGHPFLKAAINEHVFRLQANKLERQFYLYFYLNLRKSIKYFESVGGKAAVPGINSTDFKKLPLLIPDDKVIESFDKLVSPMIQEILNIKLQNQKLAALRNLLLPKLMKGEIRI